MTYIPNIRDRYVKHLYEGTQGASKEPEKNAYWQGYLPEEAATYIRGFDNAADSAVDTFFANLDVFAEELLESGFNVNKVDQNAMTGERGYSAYSDEELDAMNDETRTMLVLRTALCDWLEGERNQLGTAFLDARVGDPKQEERERSIDAGEIEPATFDSDNDD